MLDGLFLLICLSVVMAVASFLAGALPLSMSLSPSQLRLISTIGMGVLVGTSLIVIIPEGIEAVYTAGSTVHSHGKRSPVQQDGVIATNWASQPQQSLAALDELNSFPALQHRHASEIDIFEAVPGPVTPTANADAVLRTEQQDAEAGLPDPPNLAHKEHERANPPTFYVGLSLILGFILMFLIDKLPRHASETLQPPPATRHISLDNLSQSGLSQDEESDGFLRSLTPKPQQSRSLATTTGLVIHASADGIAMGASASTTNTELGFIIFIAIMLHKAPAAFGLTSVLLKQGLSKRAARGHLVIFSLAAPFGALSTWLLVHLLGGGGLDGQRGQWWTGMLLLFSGGTFLYVAMHAMQDDGSGHDHSPANGYADGSPGVQRKQSRPQLRDTLAAISGMLLPLLTQLGHHH